MRLNTETQFRQETNFAPQQRVRMTVDENNIQHIMSVLTDLYSDPMLAVIREYSTNAYDSHIAAGNDDPIEVFLPGAFSRVFKVVDKGVGLSVDDLLNIYSKYGYSTKRDNDNESGMLGLGCKAGLTYTDQIDLTAVKDGVKTVALVTRAGAPDVDEQGRPVDPDAVPEGTPIIDILDTVTTNEPNGVTIAVPVKDTSLFNSRAKEFFRFWESGTVLVDGQEPEPIEGLDVTNDITVVPGGLNSDYVVMGNIGYAVGNRLSARLPLDYNVVANVRMGEVNFTPNREALHYTTLTERTLERIKNEMNSNVGMAAQREIDKEPTHHEALKASRHWRRLVRSGNFNYKGQPIPAQFDNVEGWTYSLRSYRYAMSSFKGFLSTEDVMDALQVTGYENTTVSTTVRKKVRAYINDNNLSVGRVIFTKERIGGDWTKGLPTVDYATIKAIKFNNKGGRGSNAGAPIDYWKDGSRHTAPIDQIPGKKKVVFSSAQELSGRELTSLMPDKTFVVLNKNRWEKFMRENTGTETIDDALQQAVEDVRNQMSLHERLQMSGYSHKIDAFRGLDADRIDDPEIAELVRATKEPFNRDLIQKYRRVVQALRAIDVPVKSEGVDLSALDKYPLLVYTGLGDVPHEHVYDYLNHFYAKDDA